MSLNTKIEWTDATWNVAIGCTKVSEGCKYCYMMRDFDPGSFKGKKDKQTGEPIPVNGTVTRTSDATFKKPLTWQRQGLTCGDGSPLKVFTSSLTDVFHEQIDSYRHEIWDIIRRCPDLIFQILTKRPERIADHLPDDWGEGYSNVWIGTTVENQESAEKRIPILSGIKAAIKFISFEPLLEDIDIMYPGCKENEIICCSDPLGMCGCNGLPVYPPMITGIDWAIIGGESGNKTGKWKYRPCEMSWIISLINQLKSAHVATFVKQLGTHLKDEMKAQGYDTGKAGGELHDLPEQFDYLKIRQFPEYAKQPSDCD